MSSDRLKAPPIAEGHFAMGSQGRIVNLGTSATFELHHELARQRRVWNHFLAIQIDTHQCLGEFVFYHEMARRLTLLRKSDPWIGEGGVAAQQQTLRKLEKALKESFPNAAKRNGFPRFKKAADHRDAMVVPAANAKMVRDAKGRITHVRLPNLPLMRVRGIQIPIGARITTISIGQDGLGHRVGIGFIAPPRTMTEPIHQTTGMDIGMTTLVVLADGTKHENPKPMRKALKRLGALQRIASRRGLKSANRRRANRRVAVLHRRIAGIRRGAMHRMTHNIVRDHAAIAIEDLNVKGMARGIVGGLSVHDAAPGEIRRQIEYKAAWHGRDVFVVDRFQRSTGVCPDCDLVGPKLALGVQIWTCAGCGIEHDRDHAAARVLDKIMVGRQSPEPESDKQTPKRGSAGTWKVCASRTTACSGPPANVPQRKTHPQGASAG